MRFYPRKKGKNLGIGEKINFFMYGHAVSAPFKNFLQRILSNALHDAGHFFAGHSSAQPQRSNHDSGQ